jgi:hypothetical protein
VLSPRAGPYFSNALVFRLYPTQKYLVSTRSMNVRSVGLECPTMKFDVLFRKKDEI